MDPRSLETSVYDLIVADEPDVKNAIVSTKWVDLIGANVNLAKIRKRDAGAIPSFDFIQKADPFTPVISPLVDPSSENYEYNKYAPTEWSYDPNPVAMLELPNRYNDIFNVFGNVFEGGGFYISYGTYKEYEPAWKACRIEAKLEMCYRLKEARLWKY